MAHNKVYGICENMCMEETMTKEQILSQCVVNGNIAVVIGSLSMTDGTGSAQMSYPDGFNKDNCVVISAETKYAGHGAWAFGAGVAGTFTISGQLSANYITLTTHNDDGPGPTGTYECKVVLMKV